MSRLDALAVVEYATQSGEVQKKFLRIGTAFATRNGGWSVVLDAVPVAKGGQVKILLAQPNNRQQQRQVGQTSQAPLDDIPF